MTHRSLSLPILWPWLWWRSELFRIQKTALRKNPTLRIQALNEEHSVTQPVSKQHSEDGSVFQLFKGNATWKKRASPCTICQTLFTPVFLNDWNVVCSLCFLTYFHFRPSLLKELYFYLLISKTWKSVSIDIIEVLEKKTWLPKETYLFVSHQQLSSVFSSDIYSAVGEVQPQYINAPLSGTYRCSQQPLVRIQYSGYFLNVRDHEVFFLFFFCHSAPLF